MSVVRFCVSLVLVLMMLAVPEVALAAKKKKQAAKPVPKGMIVVVVRSTQAGCEPNCPEWISAEGEITQGTPAAFRKVFKQVGKTKLPIVITSQGGSVEAAMEIGRMIRKRELGVVVARTIFNGCEPSNSKCPSSQDKLGRYPAYYTTLSGYCASACGLVLAGGVSRMVDNLNPQIGTHQIINFRTRESVRYLERYRMVNGKRKVLSRKVVSRKVVNLKPTTKLDKSYVKKVTGYLAEMGIDRSYYDLYANAPPSGMYWLKQDELTKTRIVTGSYVFNSYPKETCLSAAPAANCVKR